MKKFEFQCGGDYGAWECLVDVELTDEEASVLIDYAQKNEFLDWFHPVDDIYQKVMEALKEECDDDADLSNVVVWVPFGLRKD